MLRWGILSTVLVNQAVLVVDEVYDFLPAAVFPR
jgi:hypothetical protein